MSSLVEFQGRLGVTAHLLGRNGYHSSRLETKLQHKRGFTSELINTASAPTVVVRFATLRC